jgi:dUTP pyrophosphatase
MEIIRIARLHPQAVIPDRKHIQDAGLDVYACQSMTVAPRSFDIVPTGITMEVPVGYVALLKPKGRNNHLLGAGVVDAGYQGELLVKIFNPTDHALEIKSGDSIAQVLLIPIITPAVMEVPLDAIHKTKTKRGTSGGIVSQHNPKDENH